MRRRHSILLSGVVVLWAASASAQSADLLISKSGTESANAGDTIDYSIFVFNGGPLDAQNVTMTDALPAGTTFVSLTASTSTFTCSTPAVGAAGTVTCTAATLANQADTTFTLSVKTSPSAPSGSISNTATVTSALSDPNTSDNSSTATTGIAATTIASADLSVESMLGSSSVAAGTTVSFRIVIANKGPFTAHHVQLVDPVPANATFVEASVADPLAAFTCTTPAAGTGGNITCSAITFDPRTSSDQPTFTFTFRVNNGVAAGTVLTNTVTLSADDPDPVPSNNSASRTTTTTSQTPSADVSVATTGGGTTFSVTVRNAGPNDASGVTLTDAVPSGSTFADWTQTSGPPFNCTKPSVGGSGTITCSSSVFPGIEEATVAAEFTLTLNASGEVTNSVTVSSSTSDPRQDNNTSFFPATAKLTIDDASVLEGNSGTTPAIFNVHLQPANAIVTATVDYVASGNSATAGSDFVATAGTLTFHAGETLKTITVQVLGDTLNEGNELFIVQLSNPVNASIDRDLAFGTIIDDDLGGPPVPVVTIPSISVTEGDSGTKNATFTAQLSFPSVAVSRVRWQTQDGTATAGSDYIASSGEVVFQPGETSKPFTVPIIGDTLFEPDETFTIIITGTDNATAGQSATCRIVNDDAQPIPRHRAARH
jgi:chitinase